MPDYYLNLKHIATVVSVGRQFLKWITHYLIERKNVLFSMDINPTGHLLGHILFIIYINNLPFFVNSQSLKFANDTTLLIIGLYTWIMMHLATKRPT